MEHKKELQQIVNSLKKYAKANKAKLTNDVIAAKMKISRTYLSDLLGEPGKEVLEKHLEIIKMAFRDELRELSGLKAGDALNPERALLLALAEDYAEWKAEQTNQTFEEVKGEITKRGERILKGLDSWLPGKK